MSSLGELLSGDAKNKLLIESLKVGDVFLKPFEGVAHDKFFIVVGLSNTKIYACSVYINSEIHISIKDKPSIIKTQIPLLKSKYKFLKHDSFANCNYPLYMSVETVFKMETDFKIIGKIEKSDFALIQKTVKDLLSEDEIEKYFS